MNASERLPAVAEDCGCSRPQSDRASNAPILAEDASEPGLVWNTRPDGVWHAQGNGGTYYMTPTPSGSVRVVWMGSDGDQKDLGTHSFASGAQVAARFTPNSRRMAAEANEVFAAATGSGWAAGRKPTHQEIWADGKPLTIVKKGRGWTLLVMRHPLVDKPAGGVTFHGRSDFEHGLPEHVFKTKSDVESTAFGIGNYMLGLGAFMDTYVHHATAGGGEEAAEVPPAALPVAEAGGEVCRPWVRMEKDPQAFNACMKLADKLGAIEGHDKLYEIVRQQMQREDCEIFVAIVLDSHCNLRAMSEISRGSRDRVQTPMPDLARMAAYQAIHYGGQGLGVAHSHPSGKPRPSKADGEVTKAVESLCDALGIMFVDHLVIGAPSEGYYSFRKKRIFK